MIFILAYTKPRDTEEYFHPAMHLEYYAIWNNENEKACVGGGGVRVGMIFLQQNQSEVIIIDWIYYYSVYENGNDGCMCVCMWWW